MLVVYLLFTTLDIVAAVDSKCMACMQQRLCSCWFSCLSCIPLFTASFFSPTMIWDVKTAVGESSCEQNCFFNQIRNFGSYWPEMDGNFESSVKKQKNRKPKLCPWRPHRTLCPRSLPSTHKATMDGEYCPCRAHLLWTHAHVEPSYFLV